MGRQPLTGYCITCRRRRVKCDRSRPSCNRCAKAGFKCAGYELAMRMQNHVVGRTGDLIRLPGGVSTVNPPQVPQPLSLVGFESQIAFSFYFHSYRWAYFWRGIMQSNPAENADLCYKATLAVAIGYLGKANRNPDLKLRATELSSAIVATVQSTLARGSKSDSAGLLNIITTMGVYNYVVDRKFHYLHHYGAQMILKSCGPGYFQNEQFLTAFRRCRMMLYCCCVAFKCRTFLSRPEWTTVPFLHVNKTMEDKLMDILLHIPGLLESAIRLRDQIQNNEEILEKVRCYQGKLNQWWNEWWRLNPNSATTIPIRQSSDNPGPILEPYLSSGLKLDTAQQAVELICYHSAMLLLGQLESRLDSSSPEQEVITSIASHDVFNSGNTLHMSLNAVFIPEQVEFPWQHGLEGLRILAGLRDGLSASPEVYLAFAPIAILYCFAKDLGIQQMMISMISGEEWAGDAEEEFGPYRLEVPFSESHRSVEPRHLTGQEAPDEGTPVAKRLFIGSSWP